MNCPTCTTRLKCVDSRPWGDDVYQRRYTCSVCIAVYWTQETIGVHLGKTKCIPKPKLLATRGRGRPRKEKQNE